MNFENHSMSNHLNDNGIREFDEIEVIPAAGKSYCFKLNRTRIDFVSDSLFQKVNSPVKKRLVGMKNEHLHLELVSKASQNNVGESFARYHVHVKCGPAIRLNGHYVFEAIIERGDEIEIGFNKIRFIKAIDNTNEDEIITKFESAICSNLPMLIQGETGTGKTSLARKIHDLSGRSGFFVHLNLSALSKNLIESELFGHLKGSFTGAIQDKKGVFRQADRGTLFLDEIDSLPWELQTKLLTFLDDYIVRPVGSLQEYKVDTRLIMASGRSLINLVEKNEFRKDFYFRVTSGQFLKLPNLRDKPQLVEQFCDEFEVKNNVIISAKLRAFYQSLPWPGNYRQLKGHLQQKLVLSKGRKFNFDEQDEWLIEQSSHLFDIHEDFVSMKEMKTLYAKKVFYSCEQNYQKAADMLDITSRSLKNLMNSDLNL